MKASFAPPQWVLEQGLVTDAWYVACRSTELRQKPLARSVLGVPLVLYRAPGRVAALHDRCPHRNVPLSLGHVETCGHLVCPYHGYKFETDGQCVEIPGRLLPLAPKPRAEAVPVREASGLVWVAPFGTARFAPHAPAHQNDPRYTTVVREVCAPGSLDDIAENALDVPHTAYVHRGLFRGGRPKVRITAITRRYEHWLETSYVGEPPPKGLVARLLSWGGSEVLSVEHFDRFFLPGVVQVEYRLGETTHFLITAMLTPESPTQCRLYAVASFRTPLPGRLLAWVLEPFARLIFSQDVRMLTAQIEQRRRFGGSQYESTELDTMGPRLRSLLRAAGESAGSRQPQLGAESPPPLERELPSGDPVVKAERTVELEV